LPSFLAAALATYAKSEGVLRRFSRPRLRRRYDDVPRRQAAPPNDDHDAARTLSISQSGTYVFGERRARGHRTIGALFAVKIIASSSASSLGALRLSLFTRQRNYLTLDDGDRPDVRNNLEPVRSNAPLHKSGASDTTLGTVVIYPTRASRSAQVLFNPATNR